MSEKICQHCGQLLTMGGECNCPGAHVERKIAIQKSKARQAIDEIFGSLCEENEYEPVSEEEVQILKSFADKVAERKLISISALLGGGIKAKFTRGAKGAVKIERSESRKTSAEVEG